MRRPEEFLGQFDLGMCQASVSVLYVTFQSIRKRVIKTLYLCKDKPSLYHVVILCEINKSIVLVCITFCNRLVLHFQAFSQLFSKTPDLKSPLLNLVHVFSDGVISLVYVDDTSFFSKCLSLAGCNVFLYWCVDWILRHFSIINFIYPHLPFIMLVIVFVDSTIGCSIPISISVSLPLPIQVLSQRFFNLILRDELISMLSYLELSFNLSLLLALVHPFTAL